MRSTIASRRGVLRAGILRLAPLGSRLDVGPGCSFDGFPHVRVDADASVVIGRNVEVRWDVDLRAHKGARLVIEDDVRIDRGVRLLATNGAIVRIGRGARLGLGAVLNGGDEIMVGESTLVSGYVYLQTSMHRHVAGVDIQAQGYDHRPVRLGRDVWIGAHAVVMPGVTIGDGAVVGSNAVVTSDVDAGAVVGGVPAVVLRTR